MQAEFIEAYVLHRRPYRETSFLVDVFSRELGKVSFVAKGIRNSKNDKKSLLQPFQAIGLSISGRHELKNLRSVEALSPALTLQGQALFAGFYLNEVLNRALAVEECMPDTYTLYLNTLARLLENAELEPCLREFELGLLEQLGYGLDFSSDCIDGDIIQPELGYYFDPEQGFSRIQDAMPMGKLVPGSALLAIAEQQWNSTALKVAKYINRQTLVLILGRKPLKSRELFLQLPREQFK